MNGSVSYGFAPGSTLVGDTVYVCQNDSLFFTTSDDEYVHNDTVYFINFSSYQWNQLTCSPFSTNILPTGTPFASPGNTAWNLNGLASTPGLYLFGVSALCQFVYSGDTTTTGTVTDFIFLRIRPAPVANAGNDTLFCLSTSGANPWVIQLDGNNPSPFVGYWSLNDLHGNYSFQDSTDFNSFVYLENDPYNYNSEFSWTVIDTTTGCRSTDLVSIKHPMEIHPVNIYPDTIVVCDNRIQLGPQGIQGTNYITQYGGFTGPVTNPTQYTFGDSIYYEWTETSPMPDSLITINYTAQVVEIIVDSAGFYTFDLSIFGYCGNSSDQVVIQFLSDSTLGPPIPIWTYNCNDSTNFTIVHTAPPSGATVNYLFIQPASGSTGSMSFISINDSTVRILNFIDTIPLVQLQYSFTWAGSTCVKTALITIYNEFTPWQIVRDTILPCGQTAFNYLLNAPGQSVWPGQTPVYNQSFTLIQEAIPASYLSGGYIYNMNIPGEYKIKIMRWSACGDTLIDTMKITTLGPPPPPSAGIPLLVPCGTTEINLASNVPVWGSGVWLLVAPGGLPTFHPNFDPIGLGYGSWCSTYFSNDSLSHTTVSNLVVPGDYYFVWNISSGSCGNFNDTINVYVPDPINDTAYAGIDTLICDTMSFWLNAAVHPVLSGYWTQDSLSNPNLISFSHWDSSSTQVIGMIPGSNYQFFYHLNGACNSATDSVTVIYHICCLASVDPIYQKWWNDTLIDQPTVLSGKYYIDGMITVSELIDITNVDMVFGICGGITFIDNAQIRANNSVFRPCGYFDNWVGFRWNATNHSIIEGCTFKNACVGIEVSENGNIQIKNNLFSNNAIGLSFRDTRQNEVISGNQFIWDTWRDTLFAVVCPSQAPQTRVITGITALNTNILPVISNNEFTSSSIQTGSTPTSYLHFEGINFSNGSAHLSNNRFTNNTIAFFGFGGDYILSNNTIETNTPNIDHTADIYLDSVNYCDISQNNLLNHVYPSDIQGLDKTAIYITGLNGGVVSVDGNKMDGYYNGVVARFSKGEISVNENDILNFVQNGVFADNALINISCNTLNGKISDHFLPNGIWLLCDQVGFDYIGNSIIRSNCIFETNTAVIIEGIQNDTLDVTKNIFTNNFLYNYNELGLYVIGYGIQSGPGNSFVSNNNANGYSTDIHTSNANVRSIYDYGIKATESNFGFGVQVDSLDILHSTASCGTQISDYLGNAGNEAQMTNLFTVCLPVKLDSANVYEGWNEGEFVLKSSVTQNLSALPSEAADKKANFLLGITQLNNNPTAFSDAYAYLKPLNNLTEFGKTAFELKNAIKEKDYLQAKNIIDQFNPHSNELQEWKLIHQRLVNHLIVPASYTEIEDWDSTGLQLERSVLMQQYYIHALLQTRPLKIEPVPAATKSEKGIRTVLNHEPQISVYPNPVVEELNLLINCKDPNPLLIQINNITGELVYQQNSMISSGILKINLASLNPGLYLVKLSDSAGQMKAVKFVKQ